MNNIFDFILLLLSCYNIFVNLYILQGKVMSHRFFSLIEFYLVVYCKNIFFILFIFQNI